MGQVMPLAGCPACHLFRQSPAARRRARDTGREPENDDHLV